MKDEHSAKGWAAGFGRVSLATPYLNQDSPENHVRVNRQTAARAGLKIKAGYEFYDRGITGSKDVRLPELERTIRAVVDREVEAAGGRIIFGKEGLDSGDPGSRAIIAPLAEQARAEAQALSWRLTTWQEGCRQIASMLNDEGIPSPNAARAEEIRARGRQPKNQPTTWGLAASERVRLLLAGEDVDPQASHGADQRALGRWARTSTR